MKLMWLLLILAIISILEFQPADCRKRKGKKNSRKRRKNKATKTTTMLTPMAAAPIIVPSNNVPVNPLTPMSYDIKFLVGSPNARNRFGSKYRTKRMALDGMTFEYNQHKESMLPLIGLELPINQSNFNMANINSESSKNIMKRQTDDTVPSTGDINSLAVPGNASVDSNSSEDSYSDSEYSSEEDDYDFTSSSEEDTKPASTAAPIVKRSTDQFGTTQFEPAGMPQPMPMPMPMPTSTGPESLYPTNAGFPPNIPPNIPASFPNSPNNQQFPECDFNNNNNNNNNFDPFTSTEPPNRRRNNRWNRNRRNRNRNQNRNRNRTQNNRPQRPGRGPNRNEQFGRVRRDVMPQLYLLPVAEYSANQTFNVLPYFENGSKSSDGIPRVYRDLTFEMPRLQDELARNSSLPKQGKIGMNHRSSNGRDSNDLMSGSAQLENVLPAVMGSWLMILLRLL